HPNAGQIDARRLKSAPRLPGQGQVKQRQRAGNGGDQAAEPDGFARRQRRSGNGNRGKKQNGEGIAQPAGQIEQPAELQAVIGQLQEGQPRRRPVPRPIADQKTGVEQNRKPDKNQAGAQGKLIAEPVSDENHRDQLSGNG